MKSEGYDALIIYSDEYNQVILHMSLTTNP